MQPKQMLTIALIVAAGIYFAMNTKTEPNKVTITGKITNQRGESVAFSNRDTSHSTTAKANGTFTISFNLDSATYLNFEHGVERTAMFVKPGDKIKLRIDTEEFDETIKYEGSEESSFLAKLYLLEEESDFFGEMSLLDGAGRSANIVANETAMMLTLSRRDFLECLESYPKIAISLLEELAIRLRKSDQQIESLSLSDSEQRIGITLIRLAEELGTIKQGNVFIKNLPFQQDIANMAGTSRETVSRTLKLLEDKSLIMKENRVLTIFNFDSFRASFS